MNTTNSKRLYSLENVFISFFKKQSVTFTVVDKVQTACYISIKGLEDLSF